MSDEAMEVAGELAACLRAEREYGDEAFRRLLAISESVDDDSDEGAQELAQKAREAIYTLEQHPSKPALADAALKRYAELTA